MNPQPRSGGIEDAAHHAWTLGCQHCQQTAEAECERLRVALTQIANGIFSGNQAAEWARKALASESKS